MNIVQTHEHLGAHSVAEDETVQGGPSSASPPSGAAQVVTITHRTLRERWRSLLIWSLGLAAISAIELAVYPSIRATGEGWQAMLDQWPDALKEAFRLDAYGSGVGFLNTELFSMMFPIMLIAVALGAAAAATAGEEERGTADLLLSLPVLRGHVLTGKTIAMTLGVVVVMAAGALTIVVGAPLVDLDVGTLEVVAASVMTALLGLLFGCVGLLLGALTGKRAAALGGGIGLAIAAFLLQVLAPMADWLKPWQKASPFDWALGSDPLLHGVDWGDVGLLVGVCLLLLAVTGLAYHRRDIAGR
jgi:ABC-2 type transport system permease protein